MAPPAVAITGGIGAGKSEALKAFERHGAAVSSSDAVVHELLREDEDVRGALRERWGDTIFAVGGEVDRAALAAIVFADLDELAWLESVLHPRVAQADLTWREQVSRSPHPPLLTVTEVPLLYESGAEARYDHVVAITAPPAVRAARTTVRNDGRERRLLSDEEKLERADFGYVNDRSLEQLDDFVAGVVRALTAA